MGSYARTCIAAGERILANAPVWGTPVDRADPKVIGALLLVRTLSNIRAVINLAEQKMTVEARVLTRCCYEICSWRQPLGNKARN
jgi:hypothetical protein